MLGLLGGNYASQQKCRHSCVIDPLPQNSRALSQHSKPRTKLLIPECHESAGAGGYASFQVASVVAVLVFALQATTSISDYMGLARISTLLGPMTSLGAQCEQLTLAAKARPQRGDRAPKTKKKESRYEPDILKAIDHESKILNPTPKGLHPEPYTLKPPNPTPLNPLTLNP